jgi:hypothetical protein
MEDFLNNPIAVGMLTFGLLLIVASKTIQWQRRKEQQLSYSQQTLTIATLAKEAASDAISRSIEAGIPITRLVEGKPQTILAMKFNLDDPMLEHVQTRAAQLGITAEEFAHRALADYIQGESAP